uniref:Uncharacterized protein n=1 Tax=Arundo donax TaxID=35708 RepID=A0A0A8Z6T8_ARUDO
MVQVRTVYCLTKTMLIYINKHSISKKQEQQISKSMV